MDKRDFSKGLRPEHAAAGATVVSRTGSESSQMGMNTPSLPATPVSPRSPLLNHRSPYGSPCTSPGPFRRSNSPRRQPLDVGFASAVTNICEQAHTIAEQERREKYRGGKFYNYIFLHISLSPSLSLSLSLSLSHNIHSERSL